MELLLEDNAIIEAQSKSNNSSQQSTETTETTSTIRWIYLFAAILWLVLIVILDLEITPVSLLILAIPFVVFIINWSLFPKDATATISTNPTCNSDLIAFAVLITAIMLNWKIITDKAKFFKPIVAAFVLMMLSLVDFWIDTRYARVLRYMTGALQTMAVALITYSLYNYYLSASEIL